MDSIERLDVYWLLPYVTYYIVIYKNRHIFHLNVRNKTVEACLLINITLGQLNHPQLQLTLIIFPIQTAWLYTNVVKLSPFINFQGFSSIEVGYYRVSFMAYQFNVYIDSIGILSLFLGFDEISKNNWKTWWTDGFRFIQTFMIWIII